MTPILLDSIIAIVIILSTVIALFRGFVKEMLTIINLAGGAAGAWFMGPLLKPAFTDWLAAPQENGEKAKAIWGVVPPEVMASFLSYATIFFGIFIILTLAGLYISGSVKALGLGPADKTLGAVFGAARGFLLVFLVYLPFGYFMHPEEYPNWAKHSIGVSVLEKTYKWGDERLKEKEPDADIDAETTPEEPVDPDSLKGKLKKMSDVIDEEESATEDQPADPAAPPASYEGGLNDDERVLP